MLSELFNAIRAFNAPPDPKRFAQDAPPLGWIPPPEVRVKKRTGNGVFVIDESTKTFGFADKPFEAAFEALPEAITDRDADELRARGLDPYNPGYAAAKAIFAANPAIGKGELHAAVPTVAKDTFKDVLAAFRAAARRG